HFVVLRGTVEDRVYLADPSRGTIRLSIYDFLDQWSGEALFLGKRGFGLPKDFPLAIKSQAPVRNELEIARRWLFRMP
ncbi:MAG: hypothetical protein IH991_12630, partial [Planctomycetes bacterium]|nr:hypothetical protein [Planctomycetota bacterium]